MALFLQRIVRCGRALDSIISAGCIVSGSKVVGSVLCPNVRVHSFCSIEGSILMPGVRVGRHAQLRRVIVDRDVFIPRGARIGIAALNRAEYIAVYFGAMRAGYVAVPINIVASG